MRKIYNTNESIAEEEQMSAFKDIVELAQEYDIELANIDAYEETFSDDIEFLNVLQFVSYNKELDKTEFEEKLAKLQDTEFGRIGVKYIEDIVLIFVYD